MWTLVFGHHEDRTPTHGYEATRGRDGRIREELAAGNEKRTPLPIRIAGAGFGRPPSFQSTPLVEGISVRGSTIERARPRPVPGKSRAEGKCETRRN